MCRGGEDCSVAGCGAAGREAEAKAKASGALMRDAPAAPSVLVRNLRRFMCGTSGDREESSTAAETGSKISASESVSDVEGMKQQIPFGNDRKKSKCKDKGEGTSENKDNGRTKGKSRPAHRDETAMNGAQLN
jgi:hypothetical protein